MYEQLNVTVVSAHDMPKRHGLLERRIDPFVEVKLGHKKARTVTKPGAGSQAIWNHTVPFPYDGEEALTLKIYAWGPGTARWLGTGTLLLSNVMLQEGFEGSIPCIDDRGKTRGNVILQLEASPLSSSYSPLF